MKAEILAPAGGQEQLLAAVRCGADAVYLGTKGFNARRNAENFEDVDLESTVRFCHGHGVRVHVTVNTLVTDREMPLLEETADRIATAGADAVIVQDPAVMKLFAAKYPSLPIHASTQCAVHNTDGVRFFQDLGVSRVVLARELSLKEIEAIRRQTSVELEAFVHGALCMSLSGGCYLSSLIGGRSGNRGLCAQPCRLNFTCEGKAYALSLKDLSHIGQIRQLAEAGVSSFKIEGRMKRPEYVAAAVTACRKALAGEPYDAETLRAVFSRSGFTDGYATGRRKDMFGFRGKEDVVAAASVFKGLQQLYDKETARLPVSMRLCVEKEGASALTLACLDKAATVQGACGIAAQQQGTDEEQAAKFLKKCGGTPFYLAALQVDNPQGLMLPPSALNDLRRRGLEALGQALSHTQAHASVPFSFDLPSYTPPRKAALWMRFESFEQLSEQSASIADRLILPAREILRHPELIGLYASRLTAELPALAFPETEENIRQTARELVEKGVQSFWAENVYALHLGKQLDVQVYGGAGLNITNSAALQAYGEWGLKAATVSFELSMGKIGELGTSLPRGYIAYGRLPVMRVRNCPAKAARGCTSCQGRSTLTDRTGASFPLLCYDRQFTSVLNSVPLHIGGKAQAPVDFKLLYFTLETEEECLRIAREILADRESALPRTGGLYYRSVK
ncbi:MAG: U32 family peptidase [Clostridia bacterium]|nr:U32 family peptidase [Clostridia bacterium]